MHPNPALVSLSFVLVLGCAPAAPATLGPPVAPTAAAEPAPPSGAAADGAASAAPPAPTASVADVSSTSPPSQPAADQVQSTVLKAGSGAAARPGDYVVVNYVGRLTDGTEFDSSLRPGRQPFDFTLGRGAVIKGWDQGLVGMRVGERRRLVIPPDLAYGASGQPPVIPPNATLVFEVELMALNPGATGP